MLSYKLLQEEAFLYVLFKYQCQPFCCTIFFLHSLPSIITLLYILAHCSSSWVIITSVWMYFFTVTLAVFLGYYLILASILLSEQTWV